MHRSFLIIVGLIALLTCLACSEQARVNQREEQAKAEVLLEAEKFFAAFSAPGSEVRSSWGMSDFHVFGRGGNLLFGVSITPAGGTEVKKIINSPETFEVIIPFWVEGKSLKGESLKLSRKLYLKINKAEDESKWEIQSYEFRDDQPLAFWQQLLPWLFWSFVGPIILYLGVISLFSVLFFWAPSSFNDFLGGCAGFIAAISALPMAGVLAYICFGSDVAVIIGLAAYIVMLSLIIAFVKRRRT